jgi:hypothetical protein
MCLLAAIVLTLQPAWAENDKQSVSTRKGSERVARLRDWPQPDPIYQGKPLSYWLKAIRNRDEEGMLLAFDGIRFLGPEAWTAVPVLTEIMTAPFAPIHVGRDSEDLILSKLWDIAIRSEAIDSLASIGKASSSATLGMIDWATTLRVIPPEMHNPADDERFIDLVAMDVEQRIHIIVAITEFGEAALPTVTRLLRSADPERRKLAIAILGEEAMWIAMDLLRSGECEDTRLGITILGDMDPVVAKAYLTELDSMPVCYAN